MADPSSSVAGMNAFIASWFTPTSLFLLLNLVIGTIYVTSRLGGQRRTQPHDQLGSDGPAVPLFRTPSLLDRVKSINFSLYKFEPTNTEQEFHDHHQPMVSDYAHPYPNPEISAPLARAPSLLERVKSIQFMSLYRSDSTSYEKEPHQPTELEYAHPYPSPDTTTPLARAPSFLGRLQSINLQSLYRSDSTNYEKESHQPEESNYSHPHQNPDNVTPLARAPSLLELLKSINLQSLYRSDSKSYGKESHQATEEESLYQASSRGHIHTVRRSKSDRDTKTARTEKLKKSGSEKTATGTSSEDEDVRKAERSWSSTSRTEKRGSDTMSVSDEEECVNAKADDFIKRFKQQLRLQRLDSLLGYRNAKAN